MIAKISYGSSLYGVLAYNQLKVDERHADVLFTSRIIEPQGDNPYTIGHLSRSFGEPTARPRSPSCTSPSIPTRRIA